jgi:2-polyprenyl-6-methoxyphenol hydroxylase-like FAD-dependent oxidoreductase
MSHGHAVVIGGSIGGMCAAQAISPFFERVTLIDRDVYPTGVEIRAGVPQARHVHALLARGRVGLEQLFPGFTRRMLGRGANDLDFGLDLASLRPGGWQARISCDVPVLLASRSLTEFVIREMLRETPNVVFREHLEVVGLKLAPPALGQVTGVTVRARDGREQAGRSGAGSPSAIEADLIIDASGRASRAPDWLRAASSAVPEDTVVDSFAGYSSRWYKAPPHGRWPAGWWWKGLWIDPLPPDQLTGGILFPIEDGRWIVTLSGYSKHYPPTDEAGFTRALRDLRSPAIAEAVALAEPDSPVYGVRAFANRFRRYERLAAPLGGFLVLGDGACLFNPIYGQGMSTSVISAQILASTLRETTAGLGSGFARAFFHAQAKALEDVWGLATSADFNFPGTVGEAPPGHAVIKRYTDTVFDLMRTDQVVFQRAMEVFNLLSPSSTLFASSLAKRVAKGSLQGLVKRGLRREPIPAMPPPLG